MTGWELIVQFFLGLLAGLWLLGPLFRVISGTMGDDEVASNKSDNAPAFVQVLSDLQYDYRTGKLSENDYNRLRERIYSEEVPDEWEPADGEGEPSEQSDIEDAVRQARNRLDGQ